jgi:hypothetical protein
MGNAVLTGASLAIWCVDNVNTTGLRTRPYIGRTGSDYLCFLEFPVFSRPGIQFESHLGHDVFPRQRRFCFAVLTKHAVA